MSQQAVAVSMLLILAGLGVAFIIAAMIIRSGTDKKNRSCTAMVYGHVIRHSFPGDGRMAPVVEFESNGKKYICKKKYNGYKKTRSPLPKEPSAWEDEKGYLHVNRGPYANLRELAEKIWPIESEMAVHFDPGNPEVNYIGNKVNNSFLISFFLIMGIGLIILGMIMYAVVA